LPTFCGEAKGLNLFPAGIKALWGCFILAENSKVQTFKQRAEKTRQAALGSFLDFKEANLSGEGEEILSVWLRVAFISASLFLLSRAPLLGGLYPFGPAFLSAVTARRRKNGWLYCLPALLGLKSVMGVKELILYASINILLTTVFSLYPTDGRKQWFIVPGMVFAAVAVSKGMALGSGEYANYLLLAGVFESLFAAGLSVVFLIVLRAFERLDISRRFANDEIICFFIFLMGIAGGFASWEIKGLGIQDAASRFLILTVSYLGGGGAGAASRALGGIVPGLSSIVSPTLIATYAFSGLLAGVFGGFGRLGAVMGFLLGNLILALYMFAGSQITLSLGASILAAAIFLFMPRRAYKRMKAIFAPVAVKSAREEKSERLLRLSIRRLRGIACVFRDLSLALEESAGEKAPREDGNVRDVLNHLNSRLCSQCSMKEICWEIDYSNTYRGVLTLFNAVEKNGAAGVRDVTDNFRRRCPHIKELTAIVNCLYEMYSRGHYWEKQKDNSRRLLFRQMAGMYDALNAIAREIKDFSAVREMLETDLGLSLSKKGFSIESFGVSFCNDKAIEIWIQYGDCPGENICRRAAEEEISRILNKKYTIHELSCDGGICGERCYYRLLSAKALRVKTGKAQISKNAKGICGDSVRSVLLNEGKHLLMISDGMGIGQKAAMESSAALSLIFRLLEAGFSRYTAIETVNSALALRAEGESFVTLDFCLLNLYSGEAEFIKTGGAPSFIKSCGKVKEIKGRSLPVGILDKVEMESVYQELSRDDIIIMISDGFLDAEESESSPLITRLLEQAPALPPQELAEYLLEKAIALNGGNIKDDITVIAAAIA
jgi:stage II sporulation protein E